MDRGRRLVDLDDVCACVDEAAELGLEDRDERLSGCDPVLVDLAGAVPEAARERVRPGQRDLERPRRPRPGRGELGDDPETVRCGDRLEHLEAVLLVVAGRPEQPLRRQGPDASQVAVELGREEACPAHLAVADHVDPSLLLVADRDVDAVGQELLEVRRTELAALGGRDAGREPAWMGVRPDHARQQLLVTHETASAKANARAGASTNMDRRTDSGIPRASSRSVNSRRRYDKPGPPPYDR